MPGRVSFERQIRARISFSPSRDEIKLHGRVSTSNAAASIEYGTNIVGGTTPGKSGTHLGLPLYPSVREAAEKLKPDATAVFVGANHAAGAIQEAIEAEVPLIVAVAEFLPVHDMLRIFQVLRAQKKSRLVGANTPGIISPLHHCRIGFQPLSCYAPGHIGLIAKSGTLSYETVGSLTRAGLGQSLCIGMGGDIVAGTNMVEALEFFEHDQDTDAIILAGEVGGRAELEAAYWIADYRRRSSKPKPIAAVVGGKEAVPGRIMGHAGAFAGLGEVSAAIKEKALANAGVEIVQHPSQFGEVMHRLLTASGGRLRASNTGSNSTPTSSAVKQQQTAGYRKIFARRPKIREPEHALFQQQKRSLHFDDKQAKQLLKSRNVDVTDSINPGDRVHYLAFTIDRTTRSPVIIVSPTTDPSRGFHRSRTYHYDYAADFSAASLRELTSFLHLESHSRAQAISIYSNLLTPLRQIFRDKEAYALEAHIATTTSGAHAVSHARISFDDSAFKSAGRQADVHALRDTSSADPDELSVEADGIVYIKLPSPSAYCGTLINGAGLAMNALDVLTAQGVAPTNFLDTGGKATAETIKKSFEVILKDQRVRVVFVNIFGGLTDCGMIAEGVKLAFKELGMQVPVVVRLRGTNEEVGRRLIAESGLPLHAYDDFFEAVEKCRSFGGGME